MIERDWESLSAYIDDAMTPTERGAFETRLVQDPALRAALADLRENARLLADLPKVKAPRNFTLDPAVYGRSARGFAWWSLRAASALGAAASFVLAVGLALALTATVAAPAGAPPHDLVAAQPTATGTLSQMLAATAEADAERMADEAGARTLAPLAPTSTALYGADALGTEAAFMAQEAPDAFPAELQPPVSAQPQAENAQEEGGLGGALPPEPGSVPGEAALSATEKAAASAEAEGEARTLPATQAAPATPAMAGAALPTATASPAATAVSAASAARVTATAAPTSTPLPPTAPPEAAAPPTAALEEPVRGERASPSPATDLGLALLAIGAAMFAAAGALAAAGLISRRQ